METKVFLQPAYVLHTRPFLNTSLLVDFFCLDYGRIRAVAKGARREKSKYRSFLQLFHPLLVSLSGRGEVKTVTGIESGLSAIQLQGDRLFSGLYLNELLSRLLLNHVEHTALYKAYQESLVALQGSSNIELVLRRFELNLLAELGYGINLESDCRSNRPIAEADYYHYTPDIGFEIVNGVTEPAADGIAQRVNPKLFAGSHLIALKNFQLENREVAQAAKRLLRITLNAHLGEKPLQSRSLFQS